MAKGVLVASVAAVAMSFVAMVVFMIVMMWPMMGIGGMGMMGGGGMRMMGAGSDPADETAVEGVTQVRLQDFAFSPANIVVDVGATVTWTNYDGVAHTVTSDEGDELKSPLFGQDGMFSYTFDEPGEYFYHCEPHPNMKGLVTVRALVAG